MTTGFDCECDHLCTEEVEGLDELLAAIEKRHNEEAHGGAARFCRQDVCRAAADVVCPL